MERYSSTEKITAQVLEEIKDRVCCGDYFVTQLNLGGKTKTAQPVGLSSITMTSQCRYSSSTLTVCDETKARVQKQCKKNYAFAENSENRQLCKANSFDQYSDMIKKILDTFDTTEDNDFVVEPVHTEQEHISITPSNQFTVESIESENSGTFSSQSVQFTSHCFKPKVIEDQSIVCQKTPATNEDDAFEALDTKIENMVNEVVADNVNSLSAATDQGADMKQSVHPSLTISELGSVQKSCDLDTPECSDTFAELKLNPFDPILHLESSSSSISERSVPVGWLDTVARRKQRASAPCVLRTRSRSDDFAYCGPSRDRHDTKGKIFT